MKGARTSAAWAPTGPARLPLTAGRGSRDAGLLADGAGPEDTTRRVDREWRRWDHRDLRVVFRPAQGCHRSDRGLAGAHFHDAPRAAHGRHPDRDRLLPGGLAGGALYGAGAPVHY